MTHNHTNPSRRHHALLPVLMYAALVMSVLSTLGSPMIPTIAAEQDVSLGAAQWILTITLLVGSIATPITGRLADGPHRKTAFLGSLALVLIGSVLSAAGSSFAIMLAGRALQGFGLGLVPMAIAIARAELPRDRVANGVAVLSVTTAIGAGLGYPITGLIAERLDYHAGFWFAAMISVVALVLVAMVVPASVPGVSHRLDLTGSALLSVTLAALLLFISEGEKWGWQSPPIVGLGLLTLAVGGIWIRHALGHQHPLVDLRLMANRMVLAADLVALLMGVGLYAMSSLINRYVQALGIAGYGFYTGLLATGLLLAPLSIGSLLSTRTSNILMRRFSPNQVLPFGAVVVALDMVFVAFARSSRWEIVLAMILLGLGISTTFAAMPLLIIRAVPNSETGSATSMNTVLRSVGGAVGSAASIALLSTHTSAASGLPTNEAYTITFLAGAAACLAAAVVSIVMLRRPPTESALAADSRAPAVSTLVTQP